MSFYITLPSNASMGIFPHNAVSHFTTELISPIRFEGEWVVALAKIIYRNSIKSIIGTLKLTKQTFTGPATLEFPIEFDESSTFDHLFQHLDGARITHDSNLFQGLIASVYDKKTLTITPEKDVQVQLLGALPFIVNLDPKVIYTKEKPLKITAPSAKAQKTDSMFIYTDIIEDQYVGDTKAPLLDTVSISGGQDESITVNINNPNYVRVSKSEISTINIMLKNSFGEFIPFTNLAKVIVKLHFKPRQYE